jgi:hypothetical protein
MYKNLAKLLVAAIVLCAKGKRKDAFRAIVRAAGLPKSRRVFVLVDSPARHLGTPFILGETSKD